jgi:hypothetical protein
MAYVLITLMVVQLKTSTGFFDYIGKNGNISFILGFEPE